jgi:hypothetical protein
MINTSHIDYSVMSSSLALENERLWRPVVFRPELPLSGFASILINFCFSWRALKSEICEDINPQKDTKIGCKCWLLNNKMTYKSAMYPGKSKLFVSMIKRSTLWITSRIWNLLFLLFRMSNLRILWLSSSLWMILFFIDSNSFA